MKIIKIIDVVLAFLLCFFIHNLYSNHPSILTSIISPVNESIFEHMKLFLTSLSIITIFDYFVFKYKKINYNNIFLNLFLTIIFSIIFYLLIFVPIYNKFGENFIFTIILLFITLCLSQVLSYFIYKLKKYNLLNYISLVFIIILFITFTYLSYNPIYNYLFFDDLNNKYGINIYID